MRNLKGLGLRAQGRKGLRVEGSWLPGVDRDRRPGDDRHRRRRSARVRRALWDTGTFSILGYDPATGEVGGAVQSRVFSVGNGVLWADANVGIVATQAIVDVSYGPQALDLLRAGQAPDAIVKQIWEKDPDPLPGRLDQAGASVRGDEPRGEYAAFTGPKATDGPATRADVLRPRRATSLRGRTWSTT